MNLYWMAHASAQKWLTEKRQTRWQLLYLKDHTCRITFSVHCIFVPKTVQNVHKNFRHILFCSPEFQKAPTTSLRRRRLFCCLSSRRCCCLKSSVRRVAHCPAINASINASSAARALRPTFKLVFDINVSDKTFRWRLSGKIFANVTFCQ